VADVIVSSSPTQPVHIKREPVSDSKPTTVVPSSVLTALANDNSSGLSKFQFTFNVTTEKSLNEVTQVFELLNELLKDKLKPTAEPNPSPAAVRRSKKRGKRAAKSSQPSTPQPANASRSPNASDRNYKTPSLSGRAKEHVGKKLSKCPKDFVMWLAAEVRLDRWQESIALHYPELSPTRSESPQDLYKLSSSPKDSMRNWIATLPSPPPATVNGLRTAPVHPEIRAVGEAQAQINMESAESGILRRKTSDVLALRQTAGPSRPKSNTPARRSRRCHRGTLVA